MTHTLIIKGNINDGVVQTSLVGNANLLLYCCMNANHQRHILEVPPPNPENNDPAKKNGPDP